MRYASRFAIPRLINEVKAKRAEACPDDPAKLMVASKEQLVRQPQSLEVMNINFKEETMRSIYFRTTLPILLLCAFYAATQPAAAAADFGVYPILDCVSYDAGQGELSASWGYINTNSSSTVVPFGANNYVDPSPAFRGQPITFLPGTHHYSFTTFGFIRVSPTVAWNLNGHKITASNNPALYCSSSFTYQGRLTDGGSPANGLYDLQFKLFGDFTDFSSSSIANTQVDNVQVTNGIFTVQLNFTSDQLIAAPFLEIAVRPGSSTGSYTTLTPRQSLTPTPYSLISAFASKSETSSYADLSGNAENLGGLPASSYLSSNNNSFIKNGTAQQTGDFNITGSGTIGGALTTASLSVSGALTAGSGAVSGSLSSGSLNVSGDGGVAGQFSTSNLFVGGTTNVVANIDSSSTTGTWVGVGNSTTGGQHWYLISTGSGNGEGAGKLLFKPQTGGVVMQLDNGGLTLNALGTAGGTALCRNASNQISNCSSSLRYKTNIAPFNFGLQLINLLRPITYDWKADGKKDVGFGAEDVAKINPLFVTYNAQGEVEGVKYDRLGAVFVNAFKEQQTQIETQQERLKVQQDQIDALKKLVCLDHPAANICR